MRGLLSQGGQGAIEFLGLLPLMVAVGLAALQILSAGIAAEFAGHAAEAGALALAQGRDPKGAIKDALPGWSSSGVQHHLEHGGRRVAVTVTPLSFVPGLAKELKATASADAGAVSP